MFQINPVTKYKRKIRCQTVKPEDLSETSDLNVQVKEEEEETQEQPAAKRKRGQSKALPKEEIMSEAEVVKTVVMKGKAPVDTECKAKLGKVSVSISIRDMKHMIDTSRACGLTPCFSHCSSFEHEPGAVLEISVSRLAHVYCEGKDVYDVMLNQTNLQFNNNKYYLIQLLEDDSSKTYSVWMRWGRVGKVGQNSLTPFGGDLLKAKDVFKKKFLDKTKNEWEDRENFEKVPGKYDMVFMDYSANEKEAEQTTVDTALKKKPSTLDMRIQSLLELICDLKTMEECVLEMKFDTKKAPLGKLTTEQIHAGYAALKRIEACLKKKGSNRELLEACNQFYTRIPHDFGLKIPPIIHTEDELKKKIELLEALSDIQIAVKMVQSSGDSDEHPLDRQYRSLHCKLQPIDSSTHEYKFGKGIYFADMSSKSANYCFANQRNHIGLLLLCEVALGDCNELLDADYEASNLPAGKHSTKGVGQTGPDPKNSVTLDGATMPMGPGVKTTGLVKNKGYSLLYNEYIVYNPAQIRMSLWFSGSNKLCVLDVTQWEVEEDEDYIQVDHESGVDVFLRIQTEAHHSHHQLTVNHQELRHTDRREEEIMSDRVRNVL
ncbi:hypothetical protein PAMP_005231 [Pampus punctatissimus]